MRLSSASLLRPNPNAGALTVLGLLLGFGAYLAWLAPRLGWLSTLSSDRLFFVVLLPTLGAGIALRLALHWMGLRRMELHVGPGFLLVQWPYRRGKPARSYGLGSLLVLELERRATGRQGMQVTIARLAVQSVAGKTALGEIVAHREPGAARLEALGAFLSEQTGWPLVDRRPENRKWL